MQVQGMICDNDPQRYETKRQVKNNEFAILERSNFNHIKLGQVESVAGR